jgi:hypothetical protein
MEPCVIDGYCKECGQDNDDHMAYCKQIGTPKLNDKWRNDSNPIRPAHYTKYKIDPWTFCMENELSLAVGSVIKYVVRHQDKNGVEDLNKAIKCLQMMKEHYYNEQS